MGFWKILISDNEALNSKNFALIVSSVVSAIVGICVCFVICWDVIHNNYIKTDMENMGVFMLCMGGYLAGGSVTKVFQGIKSGSKIRPYIDNNSDDSQYEGEEYDASLYGKGEKNDNKDEKN